ncbi:class I SAM-dependent methyltransferase [Paracoccus isoporae]|nr:class I SAM-dependent methyltransferase [Paracoccus isoporae]
MTEPAAPAETRTAPAAGDVIAATCPICATDYSYPDGISTRERKICPNCGASGRSGSIVRHVCQAIYGEDKPLFSQQPRKSARVIGLSDGMVYAKPFGEYFNYTNTFYHKPPKLDIRDPEPDFCGIADVLINSEVFEHVIGDTQSAFDGTLKVLKPGGTMVFSVPFVNREGSEHYPGLTDYTPRTLDDGRTVVDLVFADGRRKTDESPKFHGGPGLTLELPMFSRKRMLDELTAAGFVDITIHDDNLPQHGIVWPPLSRMVTARAPQEPPRPARRGNLLSRMLGRG